MKLRDGILISKAEDVYYLVDTGNVENRFNGMVKLNATGAFVCEKLKEDTNIDDIVKAMLKEYNVFEDVAKSDVKKLTDKLTEIGFIID